MNSNLLFDNTLTYYGILIGCGVILGCSFSLYQLIRSNYTAIPSENIEGLTNEEIEAIVNENAVTKINNENIDSIIDSDSESEYNTDVDFDYQSTSDTESTSDDDIADLDLFYMPNVDFNVCSIQELKFFEITSIYAKQIAANNVTDEEVMQLICYLSEEELMTNKVNDFILHIITIM
jgi:hypothetical protein